MNETVTQVMLVSDSLTLVTWIETNLAVKDKLVTIRKDQEGKIWRVKEVYETLPKIIIRDQQHNYFTKVLS